VRRKAYKEQLNAELIVGLQHTLKDRSYFSGQITG
jgi:hypothetical protein